jgi:hypothetical protein
MTEATTTPHVPEFARLRHVFDCPARSDEWARAQAVLDRPAAVRVSEIRRINGRRELRYGFGRCELCEQVGLVLIA